MSATNLGEDVLDLSNLGEDVLERVLLFLPYEDVIRHCLCLIRMGRGSPLERTYFWREKTWIDFGVDSQEYDIPNLVEGMWFNKVNETTTIEKCRLRYLQIASRYPYPHFPDRTIDRGILPGSEHFKTFMECGYRAAKVRRRSLIDYFLARSGPHRFRVIAGATMGALEIGWEELVIFLATLEIPKQYVYDYGRCIGRYGDLRLLNKFQVWINSPLYAPDIEIGLTEMGIDLQNIGLETEKYKILRHRRQSPIRDQYHGWAREWVLIRDGSTAEELEQYPLSEEEWHRLHHMAICTNNREVAEMALPHLDGGDVIILINSPPTELLADVVERFPCYRIVPNIAWLDNGFYDRATLFYLRFHRVGYQNIRGIDADDVEFGTDLQDP